MGMVIPMKIDGGESWFGCRADARSTQNGAWLERFGMVLASSVAMSCKCHKNAAVQDKDQGAGKWYGSSMGPWGSGGVHVRPWGAQEGATIVLMGLNWV
ncbi:hypothetical protein V6N13_083213 [Hibiscus sabdariffa]